MLSFLSKQSLCYVEIYWAAQNAGDYFKKSSAFREGNKQFCRWFCVNLDEKRLIWFNLQRYGTRNGLPNIKETFAENFLLKMSVSCTKVWAFSKAGQSSSYIWWLGKKNVKKKYLVCQIPIKMLKKYATPFKFT